MLREGMFEERVARGIRLLDQVSPGWQTGVDWDELAMEWPQDCILGQLYGGFTRGVLKLNLWDKAFHYGFDLSQTQYSDETSSVAYFEELQAEWKKQAKLAR